MADYQQAFNYMMDNEDASRSGAITPDPTADNPTARARFGLNSASHPDLVEAGYFTFNPDATPKIPSADALETAASVYKIQYWVPIGGYQIICQDIANKFFDLAVNTGTVEASKIAQRAANQCLTPVAVGYLPLAVDGIAGSKTIEALNAANPEDLLPAIKSYACRFYKDVAFRQKWPARKLAALLSRANR